MNDARPASDQRLALALLEILDHYDTGGGLLVDDLQRRLPFYASTDEITQSLHTHKRRRVVVSGWGHRWCTITPRFRDLPSENPPHMGA